MLAIVVFNNNNYKIHLKQKPDNITLKISSRCSSLGLIG